MLQKSEGNNAIFYVFHGKIQHVSVKIPTGYPIKMSQEMKRKPWIFCVFHCKFEFFGQNWQGVDQQNVAEIRREYWAFSMLFIEKLSIFRAKLVGGSLAKSCRNQEGALEFSMFFIEKKIGIFSVEIPRGQPSKMLQGSEGNNVIFHVSLMEKFNISR